MNRIEIIQNVYGLFAKGDVPAMMELLADDVRWEWETNDYGIPYLAQRNGKAAIPAFFQSLGGLEFIKMEPVAFLEGSGHVAAVLREELIVRATGKRFKDVVIHLWTINDQGKISGMRHFVDTHAHVLAATA